MWLRKSLRWASLLFGGLLVIIVVAVATVAGLGIAVELSALRPPIEAIATDALRREIKIKGPIVLVPGLTPTIEVQGVRIGNPKDWQAGDFARFELVRAGLGVGPLLSGRVQIEEVTVEGMTVNLETRGDGDANWIFAEPKQSPARELPPGDGAAAKPLELVELKELALRDVAVSYSDGESDGVTALAFNEVIGSAVDDEPMQLAIRGTLQDQGYEIALTGGTLRDLLAQSGSWPIDLSASIADASLQVSGKLDEPLRGRGLDLAFTLQGAAVASLEVFAGAALPPFGSYEIEGKISERAGAYRLSDLVGRLGQSTFSGALSADLAAERPEILGQMELQTIDISPMFEAIDDEYGTSGSTASAEAPDTAPPGPAEAKATAENPETATVSFDDPILTLDWSQAFVADLELSVGEVVGGPVPLRDASLRLSVSPGAVVAPLEVVFAEVPFQGELSLANDRENQVLEVLLIADRAESGDLFDALIGIPGIEGEFDQAALLLSARGETLRSLVSTAGFDFLLENAALSYFPDEAERAVDFSLDRFELSVPAVEAMEATAEGAILGEAFDLRIRGGNFLSMFIEERWPIELSATGGGAKLDFRGDIVRAPGGTGSTVELDLQAPRIGTMAKWLGVSSQASSALSVQCRLTMAEAEWRLDPLAARLGNTAMTGQLGLLSSSESQLWSVASRFDTIDVEELTGLFPQSEKASADADEPVFTLDIPILPQRIEFADADIDLAVKRIKMQPVEITEAAFKSQIRNGRIERAPIQATVLDTKFSGQFGADLRGAIPTLDLDIGSGAVDIGNLLAALGLAEGIEMTVGGLRLALALKGRSTREILRQSKISAGLEDGRWTLRDANTDGTLDIQLPKGSFSAAPDAPIALTLDGRIESEPVRIVVQTDPLGAFAEDPERLTLAIEIEIAKARLSLKGEAPRPVRRRNLKFEMGLEGENFATFDALFGTSLPPLGPYALGGGFGVRQDGYYVEDLRLRLGDSKLTGNLAIDTTGIRPNLTIDLLTPVFQLDDFDTGDWSPVRDGAEPAPAEKQASQDPAAAVREVQALLSPEVMGALDASLRLQVEQVVSGADKLGNGELTASLAEGKFSVAPLTLNVPGGSVDLSFDYEPTDTSVNVAARAEVDRLDYGLLARRIDPASDVGGLISVDVALQSRAASLDRVMDKADGHIDFAILPEDLAAGIFDLWAVNLLMAALPALDPESQSKVNCIVARFKIEDGIMTPDALLVDSTRIQASGDGTIDFKKDSIEFVMAPRPKRPQMFSAATPIRIDGRIADFQVGVAAGDVLGTIVRMTTSTVTTPFKWIFSEQVPPDGKAACTKAWGQAVQEDQETAGTAP